MMGAGGASVRSAAVDHRWRLRAAAQRLALIALAVIVSVVIHPWRVVDNAGEVARIQAVVDAMSDASREIRSGVAELASYSIGIDGFVGASVPRPVGPAATVLVGPAGEQCVFVHWLASAPAQAGRLAPGLPCTTEAVTEVPLRTHGGYVPGTGPPFDVTPLVLERWTPWWYLVALVGAAWLGMKAGLDLVMIGLRPDHFRRREA